MRHGAMAVKFTEALLDIVHAAIHEEKAEKETEEQENQDESTDEETPRLASIGQLDQETS